MAELLMAKLLMAIHKKVPVVSRGNAHAMRPCYMSVDAKPSLQLSKQAWQLLAMTKRQYQENTEAGDKGLSLCSKESSTVCHLNMYNDLPFLVYYLFTCLNFHLVTVVIIDHEIS